MLIWDYEVLGTTQFLDLRISRGLKYDKNI